MRPRINPYDYDIYGDSMFDEEELEDFEDEDIIADPEDFDNYLPPRNWRFDVRKDDVEFMNHKRPNPWLDEDVDEEGWFSKYKSDSSWKRNSSEDDTDDSDTKEDEDDEILEEGSTSFNDKYFPRVDLSNPRYSYYHYKGKDFAYDNQKKLVLLIYQDDEEGEDAPWREVDAIGLAPENWKNREARKEYLDEYCDDIDAQLEYELEYL